MLRSGIVTAKGTPFGTPAPSFTTNASTGRAMFFRSSGPKLLESEFEPAMHVVAHGSRDTDTTRRAFGLEPRSDIHRVPVQISPVSDGIANVDPNTKSDGSVEGLVTIVDWYLLLNRHGTAHRPVDAVEYDQQRIASGLNDPAAMLIDRRVYQLPAECTQTFSVPASSKPIRRL